MEENNQCIICGRKGIAKEIKLPGGSIHLCTDQACLDELNFKINQNAIPIVWLSLSDYATHEVVDEEIVNKHAGDFAFVREAANEVSSFLWGGETLGEMWHNALEDSADTVEKLHVARTKDRDLPLLLVRSLKTQEAKDLLEKRLKQ